jgi:TPR repeat protein
LTVVEVARKLRVVRRVLLQMRMVVMVMGFGVVVGCSKGSDAPKRKSNAEDDGVAMSAEEQRLLRECNGGTNGACETLQGVYLKGGRRDESTALVKRLCESGRKYFCPTFAFVLDLGDGVPRDRVRARQLFEETCEHDPKACSEFGSLYLAGTATVARDVELGCFLADRACALGDQDACRDRQSSCGR